MRSSRWIALVALIPMALGPAPSPAPTPPLSDVRWYEWLDSIDPALAGTVAQECFWHLIVGLGVAFVCLFNQQACNDDVVEMMEECLQDCVDACPPGSEDCDLWACQDCCIDTSDDDAFHCLTCGVNRPQAEGYEKCWSHVHHNPDPPPVGGP